MYSDAILYYVVCQILILISNLKIISNFVWLIYKNSIDVYVFVSWNKNIPRQLKLGF